MELYYRDEYYSTYPYVQFVRYNSSEQSILTTPLKIGLIRLPYEQKPYSVHARRWERVNKCQRI